ncbi:MAG TPA: hypothetical protein ENF21_10665 [Bacteroidetes bacterium]|nr:hypothetical protein [Bacteroidota bacterium]
MIMTTTEKLRKVFGRRFTTVNLNGEVYEHINVPQKELKFCEAVHYSFDVPIRLNHENLYCPGARRSMGFEENDLMLAGTIAHNHLLPVSKVAESLQKIPVIKSVKHINLGLTEEMTGDITPDLVIAYLQPDKITGFTIRLARKGIVLNIRPFFLLSVCGSVAAACFTEQAACLSFGCQDSRKFGGLHDDEVVLGMPWQMALELVEPEESEMGNVTKHDEGGYPK